MERSYLAPVVLGLALGACAPSGPSSDPSAHAPELEPNATVSSIVDGDTLAVDIDGHEEPVRLIGIDTPESVARDRPVECFGKEASLQLGELLPPGTPVHLARDLEARDLYGRLLAYVYRSEDGLHVNLDQVEQGYAEAMPYPPNTALRHDFATAEREARTANAGLWGTCGSADIPIGPPLTRAE